MGTQVDSLGELEQFSEQFRRPPVLLEVYAEMLAACTHYAASTVFKTMQRMKAPAGRAPWIVIEQTGAGFRTSNQT